MKKKIGALIGASLALAIMGAKVFAAPGDQVAPPGPISPANGCGENNGVGVAYDGTNVLFTCADDPSVRMTDTSGANLGSVATVDDVSKAPVFLDAIAWDAASGKLWGGDLDGEGSCRIWTVDMGTGVAHLEFSFVDAHGGCGTDFIFYDGITVDPSDGSLWLSPDIHSHIHHYSAAGVEIAGDVIDFSTFTAGECPWAAGFGAPGCWNSGLAMGLEGNLFAGTAQDGKIYQLDPVAPASLGVFSTVGGRDEDLECGPLVNGLETILSRDYETGIIDLLEAPDGTCVITEISLDPTTEVNDLSVDDDHTVTATVTANGQPLPGVQVVFSVTAGPSSPQGSDPGECSTDVNCLTDASGQTSWTYTNPDGLGTDVIKACYTTVGGTEHCAEAKKDWRDLTPPKVACTETTNPHGKNTPPAGSTTLPGSQGGKNEDGFYLLSAEDLLDTSVEIWITDVLGSGPFGAFLSGDKVKITESPDATPESKDMGSDNGSAGAIAAHLILNGDAVVQAVDDSGNVTEVTCFVPPPPK